MSDDTVNQPERKIALCYVRQSFTREDKLSSDRKPENEAEYNDSDRGSDQNSPKRQRANVSKRAVFGSDLCCEGVCAAAHLDSSTLDKALNGFG